MRVPTALRIIGVFVAATVAITPASRGQCQLEETSKLLAHDGSPRDQLGWAVAMSGHTAVVSANNYNTGRFETSRGAVYVFEQDEQFDWHEIAQFLPGDGIRPEFGHSVTIDGDTIAVGAWFEDDESGAVYIYHKDNGIWQFAAKLDAPQTTRSPQFGASVALSGSLLFVGSTTADGPEPESGLVYVFEKQSDAWTLVATLSADDSKYDDRFGAAVASTVDHVVVGAPGNSPGNAYVFAYVDGEWLQQGTLSAPHGEEGAQFGWSVAIDSEVVLVGATYELSQGAYCGGAYVFRFDSVGTWVPEGSLFPFDGQNQDSFGWSVALHDDTAFVGASYSDAGFSDSGAVYEFTRVDGEWINGGKITPHDPTPSKHFGSSVAMGNTDLLIGAFYDGTLGHKAGALYAFDKRCTDLVLQASASCPAGGPVAIAWSNATPGEEVALLSARVAGQFVVPEGKACAGTILGLGGSGLQVVFRGLSDANGGGERLLQAPAGACGSWVQLLDLYKCEASNVVRIQ